MKPDKKLEKKIPMKGIILAGGSGTRLSPMTRVITKQLLPVYDKPMVYYPLSTLMLAGITEVLIISTPFDLPFFKSVLGSGERWGMQFSYKEQPNPEGIAQAFLIADDFIGEDPVCLILGDNIFYGDGLAARLEGATKVESGAIVFALHVSDPERYGVVNFDKNDRPVKIEEKPVNPKSNWAVSGLYFYDSSVLDKARNLKPSARGELEITDINRLYLDEQKLEVVTLGRGYAWLDAGTPDSLLDAAGFVRTIEKRQGYKIGCPEEIAFNKNWIDAEQVEKLAGDYGSSSYGTYLRSLTKFQNLR